MPRWERSALLCFTRVLYHRFPRLSILFSKFSQKYFFWNSSFWYDKNVYGKTNKKIHQMFCEFLTRMFFHKKFCLFSSQLNIYKTPRMRYNIYAVGNRRQVPFVAHCKARLCEMSILWHHGAWRHVRCAILYFFEEPSLLAFCRVCITAQHAADWDRPLFLFLMKEFSLF